jgi:PHP family Zn ribbon phosphoesterase
MLPTLVLSAAKRRGVTILGLVDHNSAENAFAFVEAATGTGVHVFPGIEVTTSEEVHVLTLFPTVEAALEWQSAVYTHLPDLANNERLFGTQITVNASDDLVALNERLLITATDLTLAAVIMGAERLGGLAIPAHVDRPAFGLLGQLGFVPPDLGPRAVEVSRHVNPRLAAELDPALAGRVVIQSSDAHFLADVGSVCTTLWLEAPTFAELAAACRGERAVTYGAVTT